MNTILLTGGTGYIGQYIVNLFRQDGYDVIITSRKHEQQILGSENRYLELLDTKSIRGICRGVDTVVHTANYDERLIKEHPLEALLINAYATRELYLDALKNHVKHFIYFSTFHVYGLSSGEIYETLMPQPKSDYGLSHYFAEEYLRQLSFGSSCKVSVIRLTNGIGLPLGNVDKWYLVVNDFCRTAYRERKIIMKSNGLPIRDFVAISDVAKAVEILVNSLDRQISIFDIYNLSSEKTYSIREMAFLVSDIYEQRYHQKICMNLPNVAEEEQKEIKPLIVHSEKLRKMGWKPEESMEDVIHGIFEGLDDQEGVPD